MPRSLCEVAPHSSKRILLAWLRVCCREGYMSRIIWSHITSEALTRHAVPDLRPLRGITVVATSTSAPASLGCSSNCRIVCASPQLRRIVGLDDLTSSIQAGIPKPPVVSVLPFDQPIQDPLTMWEAACRTTVFDAKRPSACARVEVSSLALCLPFTRFCRSGKHLSPDNITVAL